jgi:serine/threonine-protein kinase PRP4
VESDTRGVQVIDRSAGGQTDSFDDGDGYYRVILGELLDNGRYHVVVNLGKGMFSSVVRARDNEAAESDPARTVAIKIVRSQETMCAESSGSLERC